MALVYDLVDLRKLTGFTRGIAMEEERNKFILSAFLPNTETVDGGLSFKVTTGALRQPNAAKFRAFDAEAPIAKRQGLSTLMGELLPISEKINITEEMTLRRRMAETGSDGALIKQIFDDTAGRARAIAARYEMLRGEALVNGTLAIDENGVIQNIDFERDASMEVTASTVWTNHAGATPLTDEQDWLEAYLDLNGVAPAVVLMSRKRLSDLLQSAEYRDLGSVGATTPSVLTRQGLNQIRAQFDLPPIVTYDVKVRVDDVETRVIAEDKVLYLPPANEPLGATFYGTTAESQLLQRSAGLSKDEAVGLTAVLDETSDPVATWTKVTGIGIPALINPNLCLVADVAA